MARLWGWFFSPLIFSENDRRSRKYYTTPRPQSQ
jgi:hypothetical protein